MQEISYTVDNIVIFGNYWPSQNDKAVILLHMMPAVKESFTPLAEMLHSRGWGVLAIDLRGHGASTQKIYDGTTISISYLEFSDHDHQDSMNDVFGARDWLMQQGIEAGDIAIGGASIGANLAIRYMAGDPLCAAGFALSPGLNYHGVDGLDGVKLLRDTQHLYIAATRDDERVTSAASYAEELFGAAACDKKLQVYDTGGHGTDIFTTHPDCAREIVDWLSAWV